MDNVWVEYNGIYSTETTKEKQNIIGKITVTKEFLIPPKIVTNIQIKTDIKMNDENLIRSIRFGVCKSRSM